MTDNIQQLAAFLADDNIESLAQKAFAEYEIDIRGVYCLQTGKLVGRFDDSVIQFAIDEESSDDDEALIDGLISRVVASMRPTPMLNMPDRLTLANLSAKFPVDIFCYLANRLNSNRHFAGNRSAELLAPYIDRIALHRQWTGLALKGVDIRPWIHWLLELDAKRNLHDIAPPQISVDRLNNWILVTHGTSIFQMVTPENNVTLLGVFEKWAFEGLAEFDERDRKALAQNQWMRGNTMSQPAFTRSWLENPEIANRKRADELKRLAKRVKNPKPKSEKAQKLDAKVNQFLGLLEGILDGDIEPPIAKPAVRLLTGANLFKKKDS
jgi:hypothetical protein